MKKMWIVLLMLFATISCSQRIVPYSDIEADDTLPRVTLGLPHLSPPAIFSNNPDTENVDNCVVVDSFPTLISVSASDPVGIATLNVSSFPSNISNLGFSPSSSSVTNLEMIAGDYSVVTPRPRRGFIQPNILATFRVTTFTGIRVSALDNRGNKADLFQVDVGLSGEFQAGRSCK